MIRTPVLCVVALIGASISMLAQRPAPPAASPALELQVLLDRAGFSPGEIDGKGGSNTVKALEAYKRAHNGAPGAPDAPVLVSYTITAEDAAGPFVAIPADMMGKAKLKALGYSSLTEALGERFHAAPSLLVRLNPGISMAAGATIRVPNVARSETAAPGAAPARVADRIVVSKSASNLTAFDKGKRPMFFAPVTSGSARDPLPIGDWVVTAVLRNPVFNYNPDLFWDADPAHSKTKVPPGPNGPVGVVWIDISKEHYGIHGTPQPSRVGHASSHGCVRLTNWDASTLAGMVTKGTPITFVE